MKKNEQEDEEDVADGNEDIDDEDADTPIRSRGVYKDTEYISLVNRLY